MAKAGVHDLCYQGASNKAGLCKYSQASLARIVQIRRRVLEDEPYLMLSGGPVLWIFLRFLAAAALASLSGY